MKNFKFHVDGTSPKEGEVFVFGSNLRGYHGAGAAEEAYRNYGAYMGIAEGMSGQSYAIPTKDEHLKTLPMSEIKIHVKRFIDYAHAHPDVQFFVTRIGCGYAGLSNLKMAALFADAPDNCSFATGWKPYLLGED